MKSSNVSFKNFVHAGHARREEELRLRMIDREDEKRRRSENRDLMEGSWMESREVKKQEAEIPLVEEKERKREAMEQRDRTERIMQRMMLAIMRNRGAKLSELFTGKNCRVLSSSTTKTRIVECLVEQLQLKQNTNSARTSILLLIDWGINRVEDWVGEFP